MNSFFEKLFTRKSLRRTGKKAARQPIRNRPLLERLEDRLAPAVHIWTGAALDHNWNDVNNWIGGAPSLGETGANAAVLYFPSNAKDFISNDNVPGLTIGAMDFTGDITGGTYVGANGLNATGSPANQAAYTIGVGGTVTAIPLGGVGPTNTAVTVGTTAGTGTTLVAGFGVATVGQLIQSTDTISANMKFQTNAAQAHFNVVPGGGTTANSLVVSGVISDTPPALLGAVMINADAAADTGVVEFTNANTYGEGTTIARGALEITNSAGLGAPSGGNYTVISDTATLKLSGALTIATGAPIRLGSNSVSGQFGTIEDVSGSSSINDTIVLDDGTAASSTNAHIAVDNAADTLTVNGVITGTTTGGAVGGNAGAGLTKTGAGTLVLPATTANAYDGNTDIVAGILSIANPLSLGSPNAAARTTTVENGATLQIAGNFTVGAGAAMAENFASNGGTIESVSGTPTISGTLAMATATATTLKTDAGSTLTISGIISGASPLNKTGTGTLIVSGANTFSGAVDIQAGILQSKSAGGLSSAAPNITVEDGAALQTNTVTATITNNLFFNTLAATNLPAGATGSLEDVSGTLTLSGVITLNDATTVQTKISVDTLGDVMTLSNSIQGPGGVGGGGIIKAGAGTLKETGNASTANTYRGLTSVNDGTLDLSKNDNVIAVPGNLVVGDNAPGTVALTSIVPESDKVILHKDGQINSTAGVNVTVNADGLLNLNGHAQIIGGLLTLVAGDVDIGGGGVLTLANDLTATGFKDGNGNVYGASIDQGILALNTAFGGGTRTITVNPTAGNTVDHVDLGITSSIANDASPNTTPVNILKEGTGVLGLGWSESQGFGGSNTYTGTTEVGAGVVVAYNGNALGTGAVTVDANATLAVRGATIANNITLNGPGFNDPLGPTPGQDASLEGVGPTGATVTGTIALNGVGANASSVGEVLSGILHLRGVMSGADLNVVNGHVDMDGSGTASGSNDDNTYTGTTTVQTGATLELNRIDADGDPEITVPGPLTILGTVQVDQGEFLTNVNDGNRFEIGTGSTAVTIDAGTLRIANGSDQQIGTLAFNGGGTVDLSTNVNNELDLTGDVTATGGTPAVNGSGASQDQLFLESALNFNIAAATTLNLNVGLGGTGLTEIGANPTTSILEFSGTAQNDQGDTTVQSGTLLLNKTATFTTAGSAIAAGSVLTIGVDGGSGTALVRETTAGANWELGGSTSGGAEVVINSNGVLDLNGHTDRIVGGTPALTMSGGASLTLGSGGDLFLDGDVLLQPGSTIAQTATISGSSLVSQPGIDLDGATRTFDISPGGNMTISAVIADGGLTKTDTGTLTLTGNNTYASATTVSAGSLFVDGSQSQSAVSVAAGATLGGNGTVGSVNDMGGTLSPGAASGIPGILNVSGGVTIGNGSTFDELINGTTPGTGFSQLNATGNVTIGTGTTLNVAVNGAFPANTVFTIIQAGSVTGLFSTVNVTPSSVPLQQHNTGNSITLTIEEATTTTTVTGLPSSAPFESPVVLTAVIQFPAGTTNPGGTVTFGDEANSNLGQVTVSAINYNPGTAQATVSITVSNLPVGPHTITAVYSGDNTNAGSNNNGQVSGKSITITAATTSTTVTSPSAPITVTFGQMVTVSATVAVTQGTGTPVGPTGFVDFKATPTVGPVIDIGTVGLNGTSASTSTSTLPAGTYVISAFYLGDGNFQASNGSSGANTVTVNQATTTSVLASSPNPSGAGVPVTFTVTVTNTSTGVSPTGTVEMFEGVTDLGPATFVHSVGNVSTYTFTTASLGIGIHPIDAVFNQAASGNFTTSTSNTVQQIVQPTVAAVVQRSDGSLQTVNPGGGLVNVSENPGPGSVVAISAVTANGQVVLFAISGSNDSLWEHTNSGWTELSAVAFTAISAATDASGAAVVFGVLSVTNPNGEPQNLVEFHAASGGFTLVSSGSISQVSAVGTPAGEVAYVIISSTVGNTGNPNPYANTLWRYDAANNPSNVVDGGFIQASSGTFANVSAGLTTGNQAVAYAVVANGQLWEQSPNFGAIGLDTGWALLSNSGTPALPNSFLGVAAEAHAVDKVFAVAADRTIWEHTSSGNAHLLVPSASGVAQISASETPIGTDELFAVLQDGELWEFQAGTGASPAGWTQLLAGGATETSAP